MNDMWRQKSDTKQVPYLGPTNVRRHRTEFGDPGDVALSAYVKCEHITFLVKEYVIWVDFGDCHH